MDPPDAFFEIPARPRKCGSTQGDFAGVKGLRLAICMLRIFAQSICQTLFYLLRRRRWRTAQSAFCNTAVSDPFFRHLRIHCVLLRSRRWHAEEIAVSTLSPCSVSNVSELFSLVAQHCFGLFGWRRVPSEGPAAGPGAQREPGVLENVW
jgi:hypothetical protein